MMIAHHCGYYFAAPFPRFAALRRCRDELAAAVPGAWVTSRWLDGADGRAAHWSTPDQVAADPAGCWRFAAADLADIQQADTLVVFLDEASATGARHVEHGYALALGKRVVVIGRLVNAFHTYPRTERYDTWEEFLRVESAASAHPSQAVPG